MNILDEITVDFDLDSKILCETPAKLKLRDKTLKGIRFNLDDEDSTIPALMLAKKSKKGKKKEKDNVEETVVEEVNEEIPQEEVVQEVVGGNEITVKDGVNRIEQSPEFDSTRKLKVSEERKDILNVVGNDVAAVESNDVVNEDEVVVETVSVEEIPETEEVVETTEEYNIEEPVVEVNEEVKVEENVEDEQQVVQNEDVEIPVAEEIVIEEPEFNIEQGEEGIVANVEEVAVPVVEEVNENEIPNVEETFVNSPVLEQAMENEVFKANMELIEEIRALEVKEKEVDELIAMEYQKRDDLIKKCAELDQKHAENQEEINELHNYFSNLLRSQHEDYTNIKNNSNARVEEKIVKFSDVQEDVRQYSEMELDKNNLIENDEREKEKYRQLIESIQPFESSYESYNEEEAYKRVA